MEQQFEFDVAFSFCGKDEPLATKLDDLLKDRFRTFIYSRKQEVLAGTDGEKTFNAVFMEKARVAVILYRAEWGETPFTRIEQSAIRSRAYEHGYDFTVWIAVGEGVKLPKYVEPTRLYYGLSKYGIDGAAAVIEQAIQRQGGDTRPETLTERAARLNRQTVAQDARLAFLDSNDAVRVASDAARQIIREVAERAPQFTDWGFQVPEPPNLAPGKRENWVEVRADRGVLAVVWRQEFANTLDDTGLSVEIWRGLPPRHGRMYFRDEEPPCERREVFAFDVTLDGEVVWRRTDLKSMSLSSAQLTEHCIAALIEAVHGKAMKTKPRHTS